MGEAAYFFENLRATITVGREMTSLHLLQFRPRSKLRYPKLMMTVFRDHFCISPL